MRALLVGTVAVVLLAGCAAQPQVPAGISDEEAGRLIYAAMVTDIRRLQQEYPEAVEPAVVAEQIATDWDQWLELQASCLDSEGFDPVEITPEGLVVGGEEALLAQARLHCAYRFPIDPRLLGALSAAQAEWAWDYWDTRLIPCVERLGYRVPGVPARAEFVRNAVGRIGQLPWTPYLAMRVGSAEEKADIDAACPPLPSDPYSLYETTVRPVLILQPTD